MRAAFPAATKRWVVNECVHAAGVGLAWHWSALHSAVRLETDAWLAYVYLCFFFFAAYAPVHTSTAPTTSAALTAGMGGHNEEHEKGDRFGPIRFQLLFGG